MRHSTDWLAYSRVGGYARKLGRKDFVSTPATVRRYTSRIPCGWAVPETPWNGFLTVLLTLQTNARGTLGHGLAVGQTWVRFGSNNVRMRSKTRLQDAEPA